MSNQSLSVSTDDDLVRNALLAGGAVIAAFVLGLLLAIVGANVLALVGYGVESLESRVVQNVLQFTGFILAMVALLAVREDWGLVGIDVPDLRDVIVTVGGFVLLFALLIVASVVLDYLNIDTATNAVVEQGQRNPVYFLYMIPITIFLVGPGEELVFRGVVQGLFRRSLGPVAAIAVASLLFGAVHVVALIGGSGSIPVTILVLSLLGAVLGAVYEYTNNLVVPAVIHGLFNAVQFSLQYANAKGLIPESAAWLGLVAEASSTVLPLPF